MIARVVRERLAWFPYNCPDRLSITWDDLICARPSVYGVNETEHAKAGKRVDVQQLRLWCPFPRVPFLEHSAPFCSSSLTESLKPAWTIKGNPRISDYDWVVLESDWILRRRKDCSLLVWRIFWGFWSLNKHGAITLFRRSKPAIQLLIMQAFEEWSGRTITEEEHFGTCRSS